MGDKMSESTNSSTPENQNASPFERALNLESAFGSVKASAKPQDWDEVSRIAKDEKAARTVRELSE